MDDRELIRAFEALDMAPGTFGHEEHVRLAFTYLSRFGLEDTVGRLRSGLRRFAAAAGAAGKYHETVTWALTVLVHERMARMDETADWERFAAANPDLLRWEDGAFFDYYDRDILTSDLARGTFVLPRPAGAAG